MVLLWLAENSLEPNPVHLQLLFTIDEKSSVSCNISLFKWTIGAENSPQLLLGEEVDSGTITSDIEVVL